MIDPSFKMNPQTSSGAAWNARRCNASRIESSRMNVPTGLVILVYLYLDGAGSPNTKGTAGMRKARVLRVQTGSRSLASSRCAPCLFEIHSASSLLLGGTCFCHLSPFLCFGVCVPIDFGLFVQRLDRVGMLCCFQSLQCFVVLSQQSAWRKGLLSTCPSCITGTVFPCATGLFKVLP